MPKRVAEWSAGACATLILPQATGNRTRVCTVAGYYSTTRPLLVHFGPRQRDSELRK